MMMYNKQAGSYSHVFQLRADRTISLVTIPYQNFIYIEFYFLAVIYLKAGSSINVV